MAVDVTTLRRKVGAGATVYDADLQSILDAASALLTEYVGDAEIGDAILDRAQLLVAAEMFHHDKAPNGIVNQQYDTADGTGVTPIRIGRDPLAPAYPLLAPFVSGKFFCA
jgi:hypothetical protein